MCSECAEDETEAAERVDADGGESGAFMRAVSLVPASGQSGRRGSHRQPITVEEKAREARRLQTVWRFLLKEGSPSGPSARRRGTTASIRGKGSSIPQQSALIVHEGQVILLNQRGACAIS